MNSDNIEAGGINVSDLPYLEHLKVDLELKATLVDAEYGVKVAESAILLEEYDRTSKELDDVMDRIEYINNEYVEKKYYSGFGDQSVAIVKQGSTCIDSSGDTVIIGGNPCTLI